LNSNLPKYVRARIKARKNETNWCLSRFFEKRGKIYGIKWYKNITNS
jgi:hypothetical protein